MMRHFSKLFLALYIKVRTIVVARSLPYPELLDITVHLPLTFQKEYLT